MCQIVSDFHGGRWNGGGKGVDKNYFRQFYHGSNVDLRIFTFVLNKNKNV